MAQRDDKPVSAGNPHAVKKLSLWCRRSRDSKVRSGCEAHRGKDILKAGYSLFDKKHQQKKSAYDAPAGDI